MWALLYRLASPSNFYRLSGQAIPWFATIALLALGVGTVWGLGFAPGDYQQGDAMRIIYIHVPAAFMSMAVYSYMAFLAVLLLVWRIKIAGMLMTLCAPIGAMMTAIALFTGSLWGKPMWGTWWIWDARLTSELILLFLYLGIMALNSALSQRSDAQKAVAILVLVGVIDLPIIHYSVYWWNTLHQTSTLSVFAKPKIAPSMLMPLLLMIVGFAFYVGWSILLKARSEILTQERKSQWVKNLVMGE